MFEDFMMKSLPALLTKLRTILSFTGAKALGEELGVEPSVACVIVDREEGGEQRLADYGIETVALFRKSDFL